jgi:nucleoside-diphosphate-sugar epimerase
MDLSRILIMKVLFIGGTRFIGLSAVDNLSKSGHDVTVFHRGQTDTDLPEGVKEILGDVQQLEDFRDDFKSVAPDVVVHMVLIQELDAIRLMDTFKGITKRTVGISSCDVYRAFARINNTEPGKIVPCPIYEDGLLRETWYPYREMIDNDPEHRLYNYDKIPIEQKIMNDPDLRGTILRLPMVYGPRDYQRRIYGYLKRMDDKRPAILLTDEMAVWRTTRGYVGDVGAAIALSVTDERAAGRIYNVAETDALAEKAWIQAIADVVGWGGEIITVDPKKLPDAGSIHGQDLVIDTTRIREELGFEETISRKEAIRRTVEWDRANPMEEIPPGMFDYETEDKILDELGK